MNTYFNICINFSYFHRSKFILAIRVFKELQPLSRFRVRKFTTLKLFFATQKIMA